MFIEDIDISTAPEKWEACVSQFPEELKPVVAGYVIEQSYYEELEYVKFPTPEEFDSLYCGEWDNFLEFCKVEMTNYGIDIDSWDMAAPYLRMIGSLRTWDKNTTLLLILMVNCGFTR